MPYESSRYARDISLPFRFDSDCDLAVDEDEDVLEQAIILIAFTPTGTIILDVNFGTDFTISVFDPLDEETQLQIDTSLRMSIEEHEPRIFFDKEFIFDELADSNELLVIVPFVIKNTNQRWSSRLTIPRPPVE